MKADLFKYLRRNKYEILSIDNKTFSVELLDTTGTFKVKFIVLIIENNNRLSQTTRTLILTSNTENILFKNIKIILLLFLNICWTADFVNAQLW